MGRPSCNNLSAILSALVQQRRDDVYKAHYYRPESLLLVRFGSENDSSPHNGQQRASRRYRPLSIFLMALRIALARFSMIADAGNPVYKGNGLDNKIAANCVDHSPTTLRL